MKKKICAGLLAAAAAFLSAAAPVMTYAQNGRQEIEIPELQEGTYVEGEALVSMTTTQAAALTKEGTASFDSAVRIEECWDYGAAEGADSERIKDYVALVSSDIYTTEELMEAVSEKYYVDAVVPNSYMHLCDSGRDTMTDYQWYLNGTGSLRTNSSGIDYSSLNITPSMQPVVAVIDTGVDYSNEDLRNSMWNNPYVFQGLEGSYGYDFADHDADPMDTVGHGTHCAGIIAAQADNDYGISGIADAKIMALKVVKDGEEMFDAANVAAAFEYVVRAQQMGVQIAAVNCSWGGGRDTGAVVDTLIDKAGSNGTLTVFAAGNDGVNWDKVAVLMRQTPYDLKSRYVVITGASDENDSRADFSDYGNTQVDLFAPGTNILSTVHKAKFLPQFWDEKKRADMTAYYDSISSVDKLYTASDIEGLKTDYTTAVSYESNKGFSDHTDGCVKYSVKYNRKNSFLWPRESSIVEDETERAGFIYLDVTSMNLDTSRTYYISCLMAEDEGTDSLTWETVEKVSSAQESRFITAGGRTYLALIGISTEGTRTRYYYFDDIAVSIADPDTAQFEKCDLMSGSSMAAPMTTAAIAVLRAANPSQSAEAVRSLLMDCVRNTDAVENACVTGGILDLAEAAVLAQKLKLNKTSASVRYGKTLKLKATVYPSNVTNAKVTWTSSNKKYAVVSSAGKVTIKKAGIGKTVKITAVTEDRTKLKKTCKIRILKARK